MKCSASQIADYLGIELCGKDIEIYQPCSFNNIKVFSVCYARLFNEELINTLNMHENILVIASPQYRNRLICTYIISNTPGVDFARILQNFFKSKKNIEGIAKTAIIGKKVIMGKGIKIGKYSVIGDNVVIGDNTEIRSHVIIADNTIIGKNCLIKSHVVLGEEGFCFEMDENGVPIRIPHLGKVVIGNFVEIGASTIIARGTIDDTIINDNVKIDDQVFIAHNVIIGENTLVTAGAVIAGSAQIGTNCFIGVNSSVKNRITIGENVLVGMGAVVRRSVKENVVVTGNRMKLFKKDGL